MPWLQALALLVFHGVLPFLLSRQAARHGWSDGAPSLWNLPGLLAVASGAALIVWCIVRHDAEAPRHGWRFEKTPFEPARYLIVDGPYRYTRNPIYLSHLAIWSGWALFYGSIPILLGVLSIWALLAFVVMPYEERGLAQSLGEPYREYTRQVSRWLGRRTVR